MSNSKLDDMMRKITALLQRADHPNTPEAEADACRAKAETLMNKYRIEESELAASGALAEEAYKPGSKVVVVAPYSSPYLNTYWSLIYWAANHAGCRVANKWEYVDGELSCVATVVGFESDVRYVEALFMSARIIFSDRMEPKVDSSLSDDENVYRLRSSGMERIKVAKAMGWGEPGTGKGGAARVTSSYKRWCKKIGETPDLTGRDMSVAVFKEAYVSGFLNEFVDRLNKARNAAGISTGGELVLANRKEDVDEAFYDLFPEQRPSDKPVPTRSSGRSRWTAADQRRADRMYSKAGMAGRASGKRAASEVDVSGRKRPGQLD